MEPPRPLLYTYRRCPYAMRARMALLVAGITFDAHEIVLREKPAAMLAASPKGTVPVLVLPSGQVLEQSWDIVAWALTHESADAEAQAWWSRAQTPCWMSRPPIKRCPIPAPLPSQCNVPCKRPLLAPWSSWVLRLPTLKPATATFRLLVIVRSETTRQSNVTMSNAS